MSCFCLSVLNTLTHCFSVLSLAGKTSLQPAGAPWCLLMIPFCCLQWSWLCPSSWHGRSHRPLALGLQGELLTVTRGAEPFTVKSESSLGLGSLMFIMLKVNSGRTFYCLTSHELGVLEDLVMSLVFSLVPPGQRKDFSLVLAEWKRQRLNCTAARAGADVPLT